MSSHHATSITQLQAGSSHNRIVIIGGGIVGSAIANYLSDSSKSEIVVIEPFIGQLQGSTSHAPGFVGQLNQLAPLTELAKDTVNEYSKIPGGFDRVGGLEIASSVEGIVSLERRYQLAHEVGLTAKLLTSVETSELAPQWYKMDTSSRALYFPNDGTANPKQIVEAYQRMAKSRGVVFIEARAMSIAHADGHITEIKTSFGSIKTERVFIATGIWTSQLLKDLGIYLPIIPVAHPYVHSPERPSRAQPSPFVRWPEHHVYARDHGSFDGFGSYGHDPIMVEALGLSAIAAWEPLFDDVVAKALSHFPNTIRPTDLRAFNGVFAVTPDGLPLVGQLEQVEGLWVAAAVWITQAAGVAKLAATLMTGGNADNNVCKAINPNRFYGQDRHELEEKALSTYNNIYNRAKYSS